jgi:transcriptional regulator with XRE-family HTH domain
MLRLVPPPGSGQEKRPPKNTKPCLSLTDAERERLRIVLRNLHVQHRTWPALAEAMGVAASVLVSITSGKRRGSPAVLLRAARVSGLPLERILSTSLSVAGKCPTCGRST